MLRPHRLPGLFLVGFLASTALSTEQDDPPRPLMVLEKPPFHWPSDRCVRDHEPGCWQPPSDRFSLRVAERAILAPFSASLDATDRAIGAIPADVHIDGFVPLRIRAGSNRGRYAASVPLEVSIVRIGPSKEDEEAPERTFLLLTSRGKVLSKKMLSEVRDAGAVEHYRLSRVVTQFESSPLVLLFCETGANTRNYSYSLQRVTPSGPEAVWTSDLNDGQTGSLQQWYSYSNLDFSAMRTSHANEFTVYTTSGYCRWMEPGDEKHLRPTYTKRVYRWNATGGTFTKVKERAFSRS